MNNFEIVTTTDKDQRDRLFQDLRRNGNSLEKQVVKFSGWEMHPSYPAEFISNWSVAYPKS